MGLLGNLAGFFGSTAIYGVASARSSAQRKKQIDESAARIRQQRLQREAEQAERERAAEEREQKELKALKDVVDATKSFTSYFVDESVKQRTCYSCYYADNSLSFQTCDNPANFRIRNGQICLPTNLETCDCWKCGYDENCNWILGYQPNLYFPNDPGRAQRRYFDSTNEYKEATERILAGYNAAETEEEREAFLKEFRKPYITLSEEEE